MSTPMHRITPEERKMLENGTAKIQVSGTAADSGDDNQLIALYISDQEDTNTAQSCPLIFTIQFTGGLKDASSINFQCKNKGELSTLDTQTLMTQSFTRGNPFDYVLHVKPNSVTTDIRGETINDVDRAMGYAKANYLVMKGTGLMKATAKIL